MPNRDVSMALAQTRCSRPIKKYKIGPKTCKKSSTSTQINFSVPCSLGFCKQSMNIQTQKMKYRRPNSQANMPNPKKNSNGRNISGSAPLARPLMVSQALQSIRRWVAILASIPAMLLSLVSPIADAPT
jgi:hypothetical protein